jgi:hypothetical protein
MKKIVAYLRVSTDRQASQALASKRNAPSSKPSPNWKTLKSFMSLLRLKPARALTRSTPGHSSRPRLKPPTPRRRANRRRQARSIEPRRPLYLWPHEPENPFYCRGLRAQRRSVHAAHLRRFGRKRAGYDCGANARGAGGCEATRRAAWQSAAWRSAACALWEACVVFSSA